MAVSNRHIRHMKGMAGSASEEGIISFISPNDVGIFVNAGAPSDGTSGTLAAKAGTGSILIDRTNAKAYINTNTKASPTWTVIGAQTT